MRSTIAENKIDNIYNIYDPKLELHESHGPKRLCLEVDSCIFANCISFSNFSSPPISLFDAKDLPMSITCSACLATSWRWRKRALLTLRDSNADFKTTKTKQFVAELSRIYRKRQTYFGGYPTKIWATFDKTGKFHPCKASITSTTVGHMRKSKNFPNKSMDINWKALFVKFICEYLKRFSLITVGFENSTFSLFEKDFSTCCHRFS